jgi:cytochrome c-type biogenesis protein CcmF
LFLIFLTGVGPLLAWRNTSVGSVKRNFAIPATAALLVEIVVAALLIKNGVHFWTDMGQIYAMMAFCLGTLVITTVGSEFIRGGIVWKNKLQTNLLAGIYQLTRRNMRRYGGYIVHFGVVLVVIGLAGAAFNQDKEQEIGKGDKVKIGSYTVVGQEYTDDDNANYSSQAALLDVYKDGKFLTQLNPEERFFKASGGQPVHIVANHSTLREDLYVVYEGRNLDTGHPIIKIIINPLVNWIWIGVLVIVMGTGMALVPNSAPFSVPVPAAAVAMANMEKQSMQPAVGVGK